MIEAAKELIQLGLPIIPLCPHNHQNMTPKHIEKCKNSGKTPLIAEWQKRTSTTEKDLKEWIHSFKSFNLGMPLGSASGYCGIDIDGEKGVEIFRKMSNGNIPTTWEFTTGNGYRLLYKIPAGLKTKMFKQSGNGIHEECRIQCEGQQTVLPPSIHSSGKVYTWAQNHSPWDIDCAIAPTWLIELIKFEKEQVNIFEEEFITDAPICTNIPIGTMELNKTIKLQTGEKLGKTGKKIIVTDEFLNRPIEEGQRDTTMTIIVGHYCANKDLRRLGKNLIQDICLKHNKTYCNPPLEDQTIIDKVNYFYTMELNKDQEFKHKSKKDEMVFEPTIQANNIIKHLKEQGIFLHFDQFSKYYYYTTQDSGPWVPTRNLTLINKWIRDILISEEYGNIKWDKRSYIEETRIALEELFTTPFKLVDDFDLGAHAAELETYIVLKNGMLDWKSGNLVNWDPSYKTTISFQIDYDPLAICPNFEKYLTDWLPDSDVRKVVQEFLGYCLIPNTNFRKAMFLHGRGKNGKSMLIEFLQDFFGELSATVSYDGLFSRWGPATLKDKLVNIFDDTSVSFIKETSIAKNLIAGGTIQAEFKGGQLFSFQNTARFIFSSQETPRTSDTSIAWQDRWFFIKFPNIFKPSNKIKVEIQELLASEKAGIFNWMIEGLKRLIQQDAFTNSAEITAQSLEYKSSNDNVVQFLQNMCIISNEERIGVNELYRIYTKWISNEPLKAVSKKIFTQRVEDAGFEKKKGYFKGVCGAIFFEQIALNKDSPDYRDLTLEINMILQGVY